MDFQGLEHALQVLHDPRTPANVRQEAQSVCDAFSGRPSAVRAGLFLYVQASREGKPDSFRMFFLSSALLGIQKFWSQVEDKGWIKQEALELVKSGTKNSAEEALYIRNKVISILVELGKREWPQQWEAFLPSLEGIAMNGMSEAALVMGIVRDLAEDCTNSEFNSSLPPRRRMEILTGLRDALDKLLGMAYNFLESCYVTIQDNDETRVKQATILARATIGALDALSDISPMQSLIEKNIVSALAAFTHTLPHQGTDQKLERAAWKSLASYALKPVQERTTIDYVQWASSLLSPFTREGAMPPLRSLAGLPGSTEAAWPVFAIANDSSSFRLAEEAVKHLDIHKTMAQALGSLSNSYIQVLVDSANEPPKKHDAQVALSSLRTLLDGMLRFMCHPSMQVRCQVMPAVSAYIKVLPGQADKVEGPGHSLLLEGLELVLRCLADQMVKLGHPSSPCSVMWSNATFSIHEYDDEFEFDQAFNTASTIAKTVVKSLVGKRFVETTDFLRRRVEIACSRIADRPSVTGGYAISMDPNNAFFTSAGQDAENSQDVMDPLTAYLRSTMISLIDGVITALPKGVFEAFGVLNNTDLTHVEPRQQAKWQTALSLREILRTLLNYKAQYPEEWYVLMYAFARFSGCYGAPPDGPDLWLSEVLGKLFQGATFRSTEEIAKGLKGSKLSPQTLAARKRGCMSLVEVCSQLSTGSASSPEIRARLASLLPTFCDQVLIALDDKENPVVPYEKLLLYEVLILVSNTLDNPSAQSQFVQNVVSGPLREWTAPRISDICNDPSRFASAVRNAPTNADRILIDAKRSLSLVLSIGRKSKSIHGHPRPFAPYWTSVLPNVFAMINVIHHLSKDRITNADILSIHPEELRCLIGQPSKKSRVNAQSNATSSATGSQSSTLWLDPASGADSDIVHAAGTNESMWFMLHLYSGLREGLYSALGSSARYREQGIFGLPDALQRLQALLLNDIESLEHRHLSRMMQAIVVPCVHSCPRNLWPSFLFPLLARFLGHVFQRLQVSWGVLPRLGQAVGDPASLRVYHSEWDPLVWKALEDLDDDDDREEPVDVGSHCATRTCGKCTRCHQTEVARDASIRLLGSAFVELIGSALNTFPPPEAKDIQDQTPSEICIQVLESNELAAATLLSLTSVICCPDSNTMAKAVNLIRRILVHCLLGVQRYHNFVLNQLFGTCFAALYAPKTTLVENTTQVLLQILTCIWSFALQGTADVPRDTGPLQVNPQASRYRQVIRQVLLEGVPYISEKDIVQTEESMCKATTEKSRRNRVKEFIQTCVYERRTRENVAADAVVFRSPKEQQTISDLPPVAQSNRHRAGSFPHQAESSWVNSANAWDLGVQALFSGKGAI